MLARIRRWRERRRLQRISISEVAWAEAAGDWPPLQRYRGEALQRLRERALLFLLRKPVVSGGGFPVDDVMRLRIGIMAAVLVQGLDLDWYDGWHRLILYESAFVPDGGWEDEFGIVHTDRHALSGEAWLQGPVILSWEDILEAGQGYNVVLHELAHKLDMLTEGANGFPPLHDGMDGRLWYQVFSRAREELAAADARGEDTPLDPYALENAGEFFAVATEAFFEVPAALNKRWPALYRQLALFYRQDPLAGAVTAV